MKHVKTRQEQKVKDLTASKASKKFQRQQQRELKELNKKSHLQDEAYNEMDAERHALLQHRVQCETAMEHIEKRHEMQIEQFTAACERKLHDQKILLELQARHLNEEEKAEAAKEYQAKVGYQKIIDKKALSQIQEQQRVELRHLKDIADLEMVTVVER
jgi:hypothetical protein